MRKIFLIILTIFLWLFGYAQFPITQNLGAPSTLVLNKGGFKSDSALVIPSYSDTVRANQSLGKTYPGNIIRVGNVIYIRNSTATGWVLVGTGGGGGGSFDTVYAKYPIRVDTTGVKDTLYLAQPFLDSVYNNSPGFLDGLVSTGGIDLVDTSVLIQPNIVWKRNGIVKTQNVASLFPIPRADTLNYRVDIVYITLADTLAYLTGVQDTSNAIAPSIPTGGILVTYINVFGSSRIVNPAASNYQRLGVLFVDLNTGQFNADSTQFSWNNTNKALVIGTPVSSSNPSAILQLTSNNKGFLMPTMSAALRNGISSPANGLMVYDTDSSALFYFNGNNWISLSRKPNLQQVTDVGDSTTNSISSYGVTCVSGVWETENLSVSNYANGDPIPEVTNNATWASLTTGAWCWYNNDSATYWRRGKLYNWYAVNDPRGLAPNGYYIPSDNEFLDLANCLGGVSVAGGKMKSTTIWASPNTGATNSSGFNAIPAGNRSAAGGFGAINTDAYYWTSASTGSRVFNLTNISAFLFQTSGQNNRGFSVRVKKINGFTPFVQLTSKTKIDPVGITFSKNDGTNSGSITLNNNNLTAKTSELKLPDSSGTLVLSVNNNFADSKGNINLSMGGGGTVTSVATGYGLSGGTITTSGTLLVDSATLSNTYLRRADSSIYFNTFRADTMRTNLYANKVPYTGATGDVDLGTFKMNAQSFHIKGTAGNGHIGFKHQSAAATAGGQETSLYADNNGDMAWQNANQYRTTLLSSNNTANRIYTYPDSSGTLALLSNVNAKQDTSTAWKTGGNFNVDAGQFIGSVNNSSLRFRTNNTQRLVIDTLGGMQMASIANNATLTNAFQLANTDGRSFFNINTSSTATNLLLKANSNAQDSMVISDSGLIAPRSNATLWLKPNQTGSWNVMANRCGSCIQTGSIFAASFGSNAPVFNVLGTGATSIGTQSPATSSLVDMTSTSLGLLIPRMTTSQRNAISTPATGLMIWNTDDTTLHNYTGNTWRRMISANPNGTINYTAPTQTGSNANGIMSLAQTWNTTGNVTGLSITITNTASGTSSRIFDVVVDGSREFIIDRQGTVGVAGTTRYTGFSFTSSGGSTSNATYYNCTGSNSSNNAGTTANAYQSAMSFTPSSNNAVFNNFSAIPTINQTGTASGVSRGLFVNPTLTSAVDFRAIEATNGSIVLPYATASATYAIKTSDYLLNFTSGTFTATLPTAVGCTGKIYVLKNSGAGAVTIATTSSQTIDGATTYSLGSQYKFVHVVSNGANWIVTSNN